MSNEWTMELVNNRDFFKRAMSQQTRTAIQFLPHRLEIVRSNSDDFNGAPSLVLWYVHITSQGDIVAYDQRNDHPRDITDMLIDPSKEWYLCGAEVPEATLVKTIARWAIKAQPKITVDRRTRQTDMVTYTIQAPQPKMQETTIDALLADQVFAPTVSVTRKPGNYYFDLGDVRNVDWQMTGQDLESLLSILFARKALRIVGYTFKMNDDYTSLELTLIRGY